MAKEVVVEWFTNKSIGATGRRQEPRKFGSRAAAAKFVMEELEKSRRHNVRMIVEGVEFRFVDIVRMHARKALGRRSNRISALGSAGYDRR
jgi:hypothetical protein